MAAVEHQGVIAFPVAAVVQELERVHLVVLVGHHLMEVGCQVVVVGRLMEWVGSLGVVVEPLAAAVAPRVLRVSVVLNPWVMFAELGMLAL